MGKHVTLQMHRKIAAGTAIHHTNIKTETTPRASARLHPASQSILDSAMAGWLPQVIVNALNPLSIGAQGWEKWANYTQQWTMGRLPMYRVGFQ